MIIKPVAFDRHEVLAMLDCKKTQHRFILKDQDKWTKAEPIIRRFPEQKGKVPYLPGYLIWVQEQWRTDPQWDHLSSGSLPWYLNELNPNAGVHISYEANQPRAFKSRLRAPKHMPRRISRITLKVTDARVQRLQDISAEDAEAEGVFRHIHNHSLNKVFRGERKATALKYFREYWNQEHAAFGDGWDANKWVQAVTFEMLVANVDDVAEKGEVA